LEEILSGGFSGGFSFVDDVELDPLLLLLPALPPPPPLPVTFDPCLLFEMFDR